MPKNLNLAAQFLQHFVPLERVERRIVELPVGQEDAALRAEQHPALGFGGVSGENRGEAEPVQQRLQLGNADAGGAQGAQGLVERTPPQWLAAADLLATLLVLEGLLGEVGQTEISAESPYHMVQHFRIQRGDEAHQSFARFRRGVGLATQVGEPLTQGFHGIQHVAAFPVAQGFAQDTTQQFDAVAQGLIG